MPDPTGTELRTLLLKGVPWEYVNQVDEALEAAGSSWDYISRRASRMADDSERVAGEPLDEGTRRALIFGFTEGYLHALINPTPHDTEGA